MTLCDTGPLVALIDRDDRHHRRCVAALEALPPQPLLTTWPCFTEAMYLVSRAGGVPAQDVLWAYLVDRLLQLHVPSPDEWERLRTLMRRYQDAPMDRADASLVAAAERAGLRRIFTLDGHFNAYRLADGGAFELVP